ncbi:hypothetical protein [Microbacterium sp. KNMS]
MDEPVRASDVARSEELLPVLRRRSPEDARDLSNAVLGVVLFVATVGLVLFIGAVV